mgnify:CR=1 FL=1
MSYYSVSLRACRSYSALLTNESTIKRYLKMYGIVYFEHTTEDGKYKVNLCCKNITEFTKELVDMSFKKMYCFSVAHLKLDGYLKMKNIHQIANEYFRHIVENSKCHHVLQKNKSQSERDIKWVEERYFRGLMSLLTNVGTMYKAVPYKALPEQQGVREQMTLIMSSKSAYYRELNMIHM